MKTIKRLLTRYLFSFLGRESALKRSVWGWRRGQPELWKRQLWTGATWDGWSAAVSGSKLWEQKLVFGLAAGKVW